MGDTLGPPAPHQPQQLLPLLRGRRNPALKGAGDAPLQPHPNGLANAAGRDTWL